MARGWKVKVVPKEIEIDKVLNKLRDDAAKLLGYPNVQIKDAWKILVAKNKKYKLTLTEIRKILFENKK